MLLTKNQLNDLSTQIKAIIDSGRHQENGFPRFLQGVHRHQPHGMTPTCPRQEPAELGVLANFLTVYPKSDMCFTCREEDWYA